MYYAVILSRTFSTYHLLVSLYSVVYNKSNISYYVQCSSIPDTKFMARVRHNIHKYSHTYYLVYLVVYPQTSITYYCCTAANSHVIT